jgi:cation diffusion facilitator family transporter
VTQRHGHSAEGRDGSHLGHDHHGASDHAHGPDHGHGHGSGRHDHHANGADHHGASDHAHGHSDHAHGPARRGFLGFLRSLAVPHSHDAADSIDSALVTSARGIRAVKISLVILLSTATLQLLLVLVTGSVALLADTIHNFGDGMTSIPLWIAFVLGRRAATRRFTYGYRRAEDLAGIFIVIMITLSALLAGWESINRLLEPRAIENVGLVLAAGVIGFLGNELTALYRIRVGKSIGSAALVADGYHARTDGLTSLAVVAAALGVMAGFPQADPIVGLIITVVILWVLRGAARQVFGRLMDSVDPGLVDQIERHAGEVAGVESVSGVRVRWMGHRLEASLRATVDCEMTVAAGHEVAEAVRHRLLHGIRGLDEVLVHVDPCGHDGRDPHSDTRHHDVATGGAPPAELAGEPAARR